MNMVNLRKIFFNYIFRLNPEFDFPNSSSFEVELEFKLRFWFHLDNPVVT